VNGASVMIYLCNRVYLELDKYLIQIGQVALVGRHAEAAAADPVFNLEHKVADVKPTLEGVDIAAWLVEITPTSESDRVIVYADEENYALINAFVLSSILNNPTVDAIKDIVDSDFEYIASENAYPSASWESVFRYHDTTVSSVDTASIVAEAIARNPKIITETIPRIELQFANYINGTLNERLTNYLEDTAHFMTINASWPGRDFKQLSNILPMMLKTTDGVDIDNFDLDNFQNYYPAYWKIWNKSIADIENLDGITVDDYKNYLLQYEQHFQYKEPDNIMQGVDAYFDLDAKGHCRLSKETMLNPSIEHYEGVKSKYLTRINALLWYKICANATDTAYLGKFKLKNV
ncbi:MAG: hypothetical protein WCP55_03400, partial [Lentisphaerota bacterium]